MESSATRALGRLRTKQSLIWLLLFIMICAAVSAQFLQSIVQSVARNAARHEAALLAATIVNSGMLQPDGAATTQRMHMLQTLVKDAPTVRLDYLVDFAAPAGTPQRNADPMMRDLLQTLASANADSTGNVSLARDNRFLYATLIGRDALVIEHSLDDQIAALNRQFIRIYMLIGIVISICVGGFVLLLGKARRELRGMVAKPEGATALFDRPVPRLTDSNRLPIIIGATLLVFFVDLSFPITAVAGAAYAIAIMWSLSSNRSWHIGATVAWTLLLHFVAGLIRPPSSDFMMNLSLHALVTFMLAAIAAYGLGLSKRARSESMAAARAELAQHESAQLRAALKQTEAADSRMRVALDRLTLATQYAGISVWEWDLVSDLIYAAEGSDFGARLGYNTHVRGGEYIRNFVFADDRDRFATAFRAAITGERTDGQIMLRYRSQSVDGSLQHIQLHARVYRNDFGDPLRVVGVDWNVTREVEATDAIHRQTELVKDAERRLERASLSSLEGHWEVDLLSGQPWISSSLRALMGFTAGEFEALNVTVPELAHPEDQPRQEAAYLAHLSQGAPYDLPLRLRMASGAYRWYRVQGQAERDGDGRPIRISGSVQDIEQQRRAEERLNDIQQRFARAVNGAQDGLFDIDLVSKNVWVSPRYLQMLGYETTYAPTTAELSALIHPEDSDAVRKAFDELVKYSRVYDVEHRLRKRDGNYLWVRSRGVVELDRAGHPQRFSGSVEDFSEARHARIELLDAIARAEAANEAKSAFLATMSHEIRTPLNGLIGMSGLLLDTQLDAAQREYGSTIRSSADSLLHVLDDILDLSKIEAGRLEIDHADMDLRAVIEDTCAAMALQASASNVELVVDIRSEVPELVRGDAQRFRQCLLNLLSNAVKFTHQGEIVVEVCVIAQQHARTLIQVAVTDTGVGVPFEQMRLLFQPYVQTEQKVQRYGGTGLGLSIVKRLVELMDGQVGFESELGKGSTFWFTLPVEPLDPSGRFARLSIAAVDKRVLIVDDNATNRRVLSDQLARLGTRVEMASDGAEALSALQAARDSGQPFDVALIDFQMPTLDGASLGEVLIADSELAKTRLILLTSMDRVGDKERFAELGFAAYLTKPIRARELRDCLDRVLASEAREWHMRTQPIVTRSVLAGADSGPRYSGTVMLVEDNFVNRQVAQKYLERLGCRVTAVGDGRAAVDAFKEQRFQLILMDIHMPGMDGITATRAIRALERGYQHTPIVALTADTLTQQIERCLSAGMDDYLSKPVDVQRLRDVLERFGFVAKNQSV